MDFSEIQELARRFNQEEAVWQRFVRARQLRRRLGTGYPLPETVLDQLDWREAERACRQTDCIGRPLP